MRQRRALGLVFAATPAAAQCLLCAQDKTAGVAARGIETPLRVEVEARLDMGRVAVGAMGGEVEVDPVSGARRVRGDLVDLGGFALTGVVKIGSASCRERVCQYVYISVAAGSLKQNTHPITTVYTLSSHPQPPHTH